MIEEPGTLAQAVCYCQQPNTFEPALVPPYLGGMPAGPDTSYPNVPGSPRFPRIEEEILAGWDKEGTFQVSVDRRPADDEYVFYDGPPFANGLPHYGHLLTGFVKDVVPRYRTMRGQRVERRFGWDCHGLPAETEAEKELGVSGRGPITQYGIARFNSYCKASVLRYTQEWERYVTRQARWVDFENDYKTMDLTYMESVMWAIKQLWDKGLMYEDYRVLPYCWECETPLSNSEIRQDNATRPRQDPAVTVSFTLEPDPGADPLVAGGIDVWVWTTTPWTLPSNLALAVGPDVAYAVYERDGSRFLLGEGTIGGYQAQLEGATRVGTVLGGDLVGRRYRPLFPYFAGTENAFVILGASFVTTEEGTGVVHMAPGFGEDDQIACARAGIRVVCPVDDRTRFTAEVPDFEGLQVFEANQPVIRALRQQGTLLRSDSYVHAYPHCWRTDTPLVYRAVTSWFVKVTAIKDRLLAHNQEITWVPEHVRDGSFGKWLANARDWSISRNRFWGSPIPVWKSDDPRYPRIDVYGSLDELERDFGVRPDDLHRPAIDELTRPNPDDPSGRSTMRRVTDVLDCWFESGSMPFAQVHYPFENREWFDEHFPGDFIVEYIGQTRGWFYNLHVLAVALFDRPAFKCCLAHGIVLGDDGQKMSKRLRNYPDPEAMFEAHGADAMRWFLMSSPVLRGGDIIADEKGIKDAVRQALLPLWNAWYFFSLYANADGRTARLGRTDSPAILDRYILAKLRTVTEAVTDSMDRYDLSGACAAIEGFLDVLTNWYIRRSRDRFWGTGEGNEADTQNAFDTLGTVIEILCRLAAPLLPLVTESVWLGLTGAGGLGAPGRLARRGQRAAGRPRPGGGHGPGPRHLLGRPLDPQGQRAAGPPTSVLHHRRRAADAEELGSFRRPASPTRSTSRSVASRPRRRRLRLVGADRQFQGRRAPARAGHPGRRGRGQTRRLGIARRWSGPGRRVDPGSRRVRDAGGSPGRDDHQGPAGQQRGGHRRYRRHGGSGHRGPGPGSGPGHPAAAARPGPGRHRPDRARGGRRRRRGRPRQHHGEWMAEQVLAVASTVLIDVLPEADDWHAAELADGTSVAFRATRA